MGGTSCVNITIAVSFFFFFAQTARALYANLQGADTLHLQTVQRTKDVAPPKQKIEEYCGIFGFGQSFV